MKRLLPLSLGLLFVCAAASVSAQSVTYTLCAACHGPDGKGIAAGTPAPMAPPLAGSVIATHGDGELLASIIFTGIAKEDAKFLGVMAPLGAMAKDEELAEIMTFVRKSFGNNAPAVDAAKVKTWREKYNGKPMQRRVEIEAAVKKAE
jgi:mono/diheme cytochrome c family protein